MESPCFPAWAMSPAASLVMTCLFECLVSIKTLFLCSHVPLLSRQARRLQKAARGNSREQPPTIRWNVNAKRLNIDSIHLRIVCLCEKRAE